MNLPAILLITLLVVFVGPVILSWLIGLRYIPHQRVGVVEKLWSAKGSLEEGRIVARAGEAGFQTGLLRGGQPWRLETSVGARKIRP
jgi:uncharacterized membrane protein YqiK